MQSPNKSINFLTTISPSNCKYFGEHWHPYCTAGLNFPSELLSVQSAVRESTKRAQLLVLLLKRTWQHCGMPYITCREAGPFRMPEVETALCIFVRQDTLLVKHSWEAAFPPCESSCSLKSFFTLCQNENKNFAFFFVKNKGQILLPGEFAVVVPGLGHLGLIWIIAAHSYKSSAI